MAIPVGFHGKVRNENYPTITVLVRRCDDNSGFLIYQWWDGSNGPNEYSAFDDWVENADELEHYFVQKNWAVEWCETQEP